MSPLYRPIHKIILKLSTLLVGTLCIGLAVWGAGMAANYWIHTSYVVVAIFLLFIILSNILAKLALVYYKQ